MKNNPVETLIGAAVVLAAAGFLYFASSIVGLTSGADRYDITASFRSAEGIALGTEVRLAGIKVGAVTAMELDAISYRATVTVAIDNVVKIPDDSAISVASEGLLGGNFIEIIPGASEFSVGAGGEIEDTQGSVSLLTLLMKFVSGSK